MRRLFMLFLVVSFAFVSPVLALDIPVSGTSLAVDGQNINIQMKVAGIPAVNDVKILFCDTTEAKGLEADTPIQPYPIWFNKTQNQHPDQVTTLKQMLKDGWTLQHYISADGTGTATQFYFIFTK